MKQLADNIYNRSLPRHQPKFKLWRYAGLLLTYKCNCACAFCYYNCSPDKNGLMSVDTALSAWTSLQALAGDHAKIHITGGEPFLYWDHLCDILSQVKQNNLVPADMLETNGYWAVSEKIVTERLVTLDRLGVRRIKVSTDPFHLLFVPPEPVRRLARLGTELLGPDRLLVRWQTYLENPPDIGKLSPAELNRLYVSALTEYPCRFTGRAAQHLAPLVASRAVDELADQNCRTQILGAKGVHIDPYGNVFSGTCSGIIVGNVSRRPLDEIWTQFEPSANQLIAALFNRGPAGLLPIAEQLGYQSLPHYADKCHLCTSIRTFLAQKGFFPATLGPAECYRP